LNRSLNQSGSNRGLNKCGSNRGLQLFADVMTLINFYKEEQTNSDLLLLLITSSILDQIARG
jgi:hypothetical protein